MMNKFFKKLDILTDYSNNYSINKAMNTIYSEFNRAVSIKNKHNANIAIDAARKFYNKLMLTHGETVGYYHDIATKKSRVLILKLDIEFKNQFGVNAYEKTI
jgi:hypothetical protein